MGMKQRILSHFNSDHIILMGESLKIFKIPQFRDVNLKTCDFPTKHFLQNINIVKKNVN